MTAEHKDVRVRWKEEQIPQKKEIAVLSTESLNALAKAVQSKGMVLAMYLNIPTTRLVNIRLEGTEKQSNDESMCATMLHYWKDMRSGAKDKDKVADLERGLKEAGFTEIAEVVVEQSKENHELTSDLFPAA